MDNIKLLEKAHVRHVTEELQNQYDDMQGLFQEQMNKHLQSQKQGFYEDLAISISKLNEFEQILNSRLQLDKSEKKARTLWSLCQTLKDALKSENHFDRPIPLKERFAAFDALAKQFEDNPLIRNVLATINEQSIQHGVYSEDSLVERFKKVNQSCRRVALIGDQPASIYQYLLSYVQSVLLFDSVKTPLCPGELKGIRQVDPTKWDCHAILARVNACLAERNLEQAVRYSNQLRGAARKVAMDWVRDARLHLELKQALEVIQTEAAAYTVKSMS
jgi:mitofilin